MREEKISFTNARGSVLHGVLHHPTEKNPRGAVILSHGMESNKDSDKLVFLGQSLAQCGLLVLRFDFAAAGPAGNFEEITYSGEVADLQAAFLFMRTRHRGKIGLLGSSMGGTVTLLFAARQLDIATIVILAAPVHPELIIDRLLTPAEVRHWRETGYTFYHGRRLNASLLEDLQEIDVPEAARQITCPVLILHGDRDELVPVGEAHELHGALSGPKRLSILEGGDHRFSDTAIMKRALTEVIDWLCVSLD
jgi:putative redox protein